MATKAINEQWSIDETETVSLEDMKYTVIRVKRKITDDPEKALSVNSKKVLIMFTLKIHRRVEGSALTLENLETITFCGNYKYNFSEGLMIFFNIVEVCR